MFANDRALRTVSDNPWRKIKAKYEIVENWQTFQRGSRDLFALKRERSENIRGQIRHVGTVDISQRVLVE